MFAAADEAAREHAWAGFLQVHNRLLLHVARCLGGDHDLVMDRYTYVLERLRQDDYRRLREYVADGRSSFSTWLIVVTRRLVLDHHRQRYGRIQSSTDSSIAQHRQRRRLVDLVGDQASLDLIETSTADAPDAVMERTDRAARLQQALAELAPEDRLLLRLRYEEEVSVPALARMLQEPSPFKLYRRLDKVLDRLRRRLMEAGMEDPVS